MSYKVFVTADFKKQAKRISKKHPSLKSDLSKLIDSLEVNPIQGTALKHDCYKIRMAISSKGKGKRGGARIISCVKIINEVVYLVSIYDKSRKESISDSELNELLFVAGLL
ncbi:hypothetical protein EYV94_14910 [Puteibacter caeruleilacunae]|nr:hypothetical protein EYV94_14910 [Puteibacter caeruleilacunae]